MRSFLFPLREYGNKRLCSLHFYLQIILTVYYLNLVFGINLVDQELLEHQIFMKGHQHCVSVNLFYFESAAKTSAPTKRVLFRNVIFFYFYLFHIIWFRQ